MSVQDTCTDLQQNDLQRTELALASLLEYSALCFGLYVSLPTLRTNLVSPKSGSTYGPKQRVERRPTRAL